MGVYEKHGKATRLAAEHSPYDLALMLVEKECERDALAARVDRLSGLVSDAVEDETEFETEWNAAARDALYDENDDLQEETTHD